MGYTSYWYQKKVSDEQWNKFIEVCKKLHENLPKTSNCAGGYFKNEPLLIGGNNYGEKPTFNNELVWFNGVHKTKDLGHETFVIEKDFTDDFNFCKTARKPYDLLVCACLIAAKRILNFEVSSDGNKSDWQPAFNYYNSVTGENVVNFMT